jgi:hypothetical protein
MEVDSSASELFHVGRKLEAFFVFYNSYDVKINELFLW